MRDTLAWVYNFIKRDFFDPTPSFGFPISPYRGSLDGVL